MDRKTKDKIKEKLNEVIVSVENLPDEPESDKLKITNTEYEDDQIDIWQFIKQDRERIEKLESRLDSIDESNRQREVKYEPCKICGTKYYWSPSVKELICKDCREKREPESNYKLCNECGEIRYHNEGYDVCNRCQEKWFTTAIPTLDKEIENADAVQEAFSPVMDAIYDKQDEKKCPISLEKKILLLKKIDEVRKLIAQIEVNK